MVQLGKFDTRWSSESLSDCKSLAQSCRVSSYKLFVRHIYVNKAGYTGLLLEATGLVFEEILVELML